MASFVVSDVRYVFSTTNTNAKSPPDLARHAAVEAAMRPLVEAMFPRVQLKQFDVGYVITANDQPAAIAAAASKVAQFITADWSGGPPGGVVTVTPPSVANEWEVLPNNGHRIHCWIQTSSTTAPNPAPISVSKDLLAGGAFTGYAGVAFTLSATLKP